MTGHRSEVSGEECGAVTAHSIFDFDGAMGVPARRVSSWSARGEQSRMQRDSQQSRATTFGIVERDDLTF